MKFYSRIFNKVLKISYIFQSFADKNFSNLNIIEPSVSHSNWRDYIIANFDKPNYKILEIGSREVTGKSNLRERFTNASYLGFDYYAGKNVDVVGDVHKLSTYFENEKFDLIFSSACFEHFAMPWIASIEIIKCLKFGGHVFIETHFSFGLHEMPWNFFQFSNKGLEVLFPSIFGIKTIESGLANPIIGRFSKFSSPYLKYQQVKNLYCHSYFLGLKVADLNDISYHNLDTSELVNSTVYPSASIK